MFRSSVPYAVIGVVAKQRDLSIQSLHKHLTEKGMDISLPNFYKIIAHMIDDQILIKPKGRVQLHALFMRYIFNLTEETQKIYRHEEEDSIQSLTPGQQQSWDETNLYDLNVIRMDLLGQLVKLHPETAGYHYVSHPYYLLSTPEKEIPNMEDLASSKEKSQILIGNISFLDKYGASLLSPQKFTAQCKENNLFPEEGYCVDIIGDYIIECTLPRHISEHFNLFFTTIMGVEGYKKDLFCQVLKMKASCSLKLIYSPEHAQKMRLKIKKLCR